MENKFIYDQYLQNRMIEKTAPQFDMLKTLETYKKSVDAFNSYGLKKKTQSDNPEASNQPVKKVLAEKNWHINPINSNNKPTLIVSIFCYSLSLRFFCSFFKLDD